jgi:hypothetical protein
MMEAIMVEQCGELRYTDPLDKLRGTSGYRHGPSPRERMAQQRRLDTPVPSWEDIDTRIGQWLEVERQKFEQTLAARLEEERELWREVTAGALAQVLHDAPPGPQGPPGPAGKLPSVRVWKAGQVAYEDQVFTFEGASFQALRNTGQEPGGTDWVQITRAGRDGVIPHLRGTYDAKESYKKFDIVALNGSSFIARKDDPGECPGSGWQLHASAGRSGGRGERGEQGPRGPQGPKGDTPLITGWSIDAKSYVAIPLMSDGRKGAPLELRELFKQFVIDAR